MWQEVGFILSFFKQEHAFSKKTNIILTHIYRSYLWSHPLDTYGISRQFGGLGDGFGLDGILPFLLLLLAFGGLIFGTLLFTQTQAGTTTVPGTISFAGSSTFTNVTVQGNNITNMASPNNTLSAINMNNNTNTLNNTNNNVNVSVTVTTAAPGILI